MFEMDTVSHSIRTAKAFLGLVGNNRAFAAGIRLAGRIATRDELAPAGVEGEDVGYGVSVLGSLCDPDLSQTGEIAIVIAHCEGAEYDDFA